MRRRRTTTPTCTITVTTQKSPSPDQEDENAETQQDQNQQERVVVEDYVSSSSNHDQDMGGGMDQAENFQQDHVADENAQEESAVEKIQQEELQHPTVQQETVDISDEEDDVWIPDEDLEQLEKDLHKFIAWKRIRNLHLVDQTEAMNTDPERLRDLEIWALEFCKDIPATEFCYKISNPHLRRLAKFKYNQLRTKVLAKEQAARDEAERQKGKLKEKVEIPAEELKKEQEMVTEISFKHNLEEFLHHQARLAEMRQLKISEMELDLLEDQRLKEKTAERFLKSSLGSINREAMVLWQDDEDTGVKSKFDGVSESDKVETEQERSPARPETDENEQAKSPARTERVEEEAATSITPAKSAKIAKAKQILSKIKNPVQMKKKGKALFPSGNVALDKMHKKMKKSRKTQKKVIAETEGMKTVLTELLDMVKKISLDNEQMKERQLKLEAEMKLGERKLKQQETAPQPQVISDSESEPVAEAKSSKAEKRKADQTEKEAETKRRRKASLKVSKSKKAQEEAQKEQEEEPAKKTVSLNYDEYMDRLQEQSLPLPSKKYVIAELNKDQQDLAQLSVDSPYISAANMREVFLCKRAWGYMDKLSDTKAWIEWQKDRYKAEERLEAGKAKSENIITRIQLAITNHEDGVPVTSQFSPASNWYKEWGEILTQDKWNRSLWFLQDKLNLPVKVAEEVLYFYYVNSVRMLREANPTRDRTTCAKLAMADIFELQLNWEIWGNSKGKVLGD